VTTAGAATESHEKTRVTPAPIVVEVRGIRPDADELDVDVEIAANADHVAEQASIGIHRIGFRFAKKAHRGAGREQAFRDRRRLLPVALRGEVDLGRVDLDETNVASARERDGVTVDDVVDASELARA
jgi:hypothetical protein